jgi:hypothetical protein
MIFYHHTNDDVPVISTKPRLIPNSISLASAKHASSIWGKNRFSVEIHPSAKIAHIRVYGNRKPGEQDFWHSRWGKKNDTPGERGKKIRDWAEKNGYDGVHLHGIPHAGEDLAMFKLDKLKFIKQRYSNTGWVNEDVPANYAGDSAGTNVAGLDANPPVNPKKKGKSLKKILRRTDESS